MKKNAAHKAWDTRRAAAKARSDAAYKAWATRRRLKIISGVDMPRSKKKTAKPTVTVQPANTAAMHQPSIEGIMEQLRSLLSAASVPAQPASPVVAEVQGPTAESLHGQNIATIAAALAQAEAWSAADKDGIGAEYAVRAKQIRYVIWTRKYSV